MFELDPRKWWTSLILQILAVLFVITAVPYAVGYFTAKRNYTKCQELKEKTGTKMFYSTVVGECFSVVLNQVYDPQIFIRAKEMKKENDLRKTTKTNPD